MAEHGTPPQAPRGENRGLEDRAGELVGDPQPTHPLAVGQSDLLGRVHLPDLVGSARPVASGVGSTPGGSGVEAGSGEPPLEGPLAGDPPSREPLCQQDGDQAGTPARVLASHRLGGVEQVGVGGGAEAAAGVVVGGDRGLAEEAEAGEQAAGGIGLQVEILDDLVKAMAITAALKEGAADREGNGSCHGTAPLLDAGPRVSHPRPCGVS